MGNSVCRTLMVSLSWRLTLAGRKAYSDLLAYRNRDREGEPAALAFLLAFRFFSHLIKGSGEFGSSSNNAASLSRLHQANLKRLVRFDKDF